MSLSAKAVRDKPTALRCSVARLAPSRCWTICEAGWKNLFAHCPPRARLRARSVMRSRTGVRSHAMSTMGCWRSITRRPDGSFAPSLSDARITFFVARTQAANALPPSTRSSVQPNSMDSPRTLSPPSPDPHRRPTGQPDRRTAPLEPRRQTQYPLFRTLLTASRSVHLNISGHLADQFQSQKENIGHWSTGEDHLSITHKYFV
jgi:hypothetical protein